MAKGYVSFEYRVWTSTIVEVGRVEERIASGRNVFGIRWWSLSTIVIFVELD